VVAAVVTIFAKREALWHRFKGLWPNDRPSGAQSDSSAPGRRLGDGPVPVSRSQPGLEPACRRVLGDRCCDTCAREERQCAVVCPDCPAATNAWCCWKLHNEKVEEHVLPRPVRQVACLQCLLQQDASEGCAEATCSNHGRFAAQHCLKCTVYRAVSMFHCDECNGCKYVATTG
jgi:hypothetical protein